MEYLTQDNDRINKYEVIFDKDKIRDIQLTIIDKSSFIQHQSYEDVENTNLFEKCEIRNYKSTYVGEKEIKGELREIYRHEYDAYHVPRLVDLIDEFLSGSVDALSKILSYTEKCWNPKDSIERRLEKANEECQELILKSQDRNKLLQALLNIENLEVLLEQNKNQTSYKPYYEYLLSSIEFKLVDSIDLETFKKVQGLVCLDTTKIVREEKPKEFQKIRANQ